LESASGANCRKRRERACPAKVVRRYPRAMTPRGEILGVHFKSLIASFPTAAVREPELQQTVAAMSPAGWYSWQLYIDASHKLTRGLPYDAIVRAGKNNILRAKPVFVEQGFTRSEQILEDWGRVWNANLRGTPKADLITTHSYRPGAVVIEAGDAHVPGLIEGYMCGFVEAFNGRVLSFTRKPSPLSPTRTLFSMEWSST
jgi:hypothetical protein